MTIQCKKVLKGIKKLTNNTTLEISYVIGESYFCLEDCADSDTIFDYTDLESEIDSIMDALIQEGYLSYGYNNYHFKLTQKGIHAFQYSCRAFKEFLFRSILTPVVVSAITTLVTLWIKGLLQLL